MTAPGLVAVALLLPAAAAWSIAGWLGVAAGASFLARAGRVAIAALGGAGLSSLVAFAWLLGGGALGHGYAAADALLFAAVAVAIPLWSRPSGPGARRLPAEAPGPRDIAAAAALLGALAVALGCVAAIAAATPNGGLDAWMTWNLKARFLLRAGDAWRLAFASDLAWSSTEYPLLLPLAVARLWAYAGETALAPAALAATCTAAAPLALAWAVGGSGDAWRGAVAGLLLLATPGFVSLGASQYADVPLAAFLVTGVGVLFASPPGSGRSGNLAAAGFLLGLAGWTKNDGLAAAAIAVMVHLAFALRARPRAVGRDLAAIALGAAAPAAAWVAFHQWISPRVSGSLFLGRTPTSLAQRLVDGPRWAAAIRGIVEHLPGFRLGFPAVVLGLAALLAARERVLPRSQALAITGLLLGVDALVFTMGGWDLAWQIRWAADRLALQAWPLLLLGLFAIESRSANGTPARERAPGNAT